MHFLISFVIFNHPPILSGLQLANVLYLIHFFFQFLNGAVKLIQLEISL